MHIHEIEELELEMNWEHPGAAEAREHNRMEGYWAELEAADDECSACGDLGYTIEINDDGEEYIANCFDCFVAAHERDAA